MSHRSSFASLNVLHVTDVPGKFAGVKFRGRGQKYEAFVYIDAKRRKSVGRFVFKSEAVAQRAYAMRFGVEKALERWETIRALKKDLEQKIPVRDESIEAFHRQQREIETQALRILKLL